MQDLKVTLIQSPLHWEDPVANMAMFEEKIWSIEEETDIILLPEMFTTGFSMDAEKLAEPMNLHSFKWMQKMAAQRKCVLAGSIIIQEGGKYFNRLIWMKPDGTWLSYDKKHLFTFAGEQEYFNAGSAKVFAEYKGWKILPLICYDLRFPVWARNSPEDPYDLVFYVANWPEPRVSAWTALLKARAIENAAYCIGLNRIGVDGKGLNYNGQSGAYDHLGTHLLEANDAEGIFSVTLSKSRLDAYREKFPVLNDADNFKMT
jgi:predicted amidohydrolase